MSRIIEPFEQFFDGAGEPLIHGWLLFLQSGSVSTYKDTYHDADEAILNTNPLQLDSEGRCPDVFGTGTYKVVLYTNDELLNQHSVQVSVKDPVGGTGDKADFADWNANTVYDVNDTVKGTDGEYYESLSNSNQGNDPTSSPTYWKRIGFIEYWNATISYSTGDRVLYSPDGADYVSLTDSNLNNIPPDSSSEWDPVSAPTVAPFPSGGIIMWSGLLANVPSGWSLCDGTGGTPNLLDTFVMGVATDATDPGATGGSSTITESNLPSHSHDDGTLATDTEAGHTHGDGSLSAAANGDHTHDYNGGGTSGSGGALVTNSYYPFSYETSSAGSHSHTISGTTGYGGSHSHTVSGSTGDTGSGTDYTPVYYALAFIIKD